MTDADWGTAGPGDAFRGTGWIPEPVHSDRPEDVPEVMAARAEGYHPAPEDPLWCFLPAIWPPTQRAWVRDCRVRYLMRRCGDEPPQRLPWTAAEYGEMEDLTNAMLAELGVPARPGGRIWLLRLPKQYPDLQVVLDDIRAGWLATGELDSDTPEFVAYARSWIHDLF